MSTLSLRILTSLALLFLIFLSLKNSSILLITLLLLNFISINEFYLIFKNIFKKKIFLTFVSICFSVIYLSLFSIVVWLYLSSTDQIKIISLIFLILICVLTDIGGFIFGKLIGGKKLTKISPNKTYSGMIGSLLFSLFFGFLYYYFQKNILILNINVFIVILIVSLISQFGDLVISFLKRKAKMKDTGAILPGHGGILDRIDGILLAIPLGIVLISI